MSDDIVGVLVSQEIEGTYRPSPGGLMFSRPYCTVDEMIADLTPTTGGDEGRLLEWIQFASEFIDRKIGNFIPVTGQKCFDGNGKDVLLVPPLLRVTNLVDYQNTYVEGDYLLYPRNRHWEHGPYSWIVHAPTGRYRAWNALANAVSIDGLWGKWDHSIDCGATLGAGISDSSESLLVSDGSKVSAGMVLLLEDEQAVVTGTGSPASETTLAGDCAATDETLTLADASGLYAGEVLRVGFEKMKVLDTNATTDQALVLRQYNGTKQVAHTADDVVEVYRTYRIQRGVNGTTAAVHTSGKTIYRYVPPKPINELCRIITGLIKSLTASAFAGRTGNAELGQVFYNDAFPRDADLAKYKALYEVGE